MGILSPFGLPVQAMLSGRRVDLVPPRQNRWLSGADGMTVYSACNPTDQGNLVNGLVDLPWEHLLNERHTLIFDLGNNYFIEALRVYKITAASIYDLTRIDVWVGFSPANWGAQNGFNLDTTTSGLGWVTANGVINASGRYVKMVFDSYNTDRHVRIGEVQFYI